MLSAVASAETAYFEALRRREFSRLDAHDCAYLDYTGSALYGASQLVAQSELLADGIFGNPHSEHAPSRESAMRIAAARRTTLAWFDVDEDTHAVCFVANASAAIKLVAESYPFSPQRGLLLSADNHNSVNGMREYARRAAAPVQILPLGADLRLDTPEQRLIDCSQRGRGLLGFPAQSNFSGVKHPLALVSQAHALGWDVLLDAAAYAAGSPLSLRRCPAQFTAISFYKMFGLPTGLGALITCRKAMARLRRPWFAGGTVDYASVQLDRHRLRADETGFEDGTPNFLGIGTIGAGFEFLQELHSEGLSMRLHALTREFLRGLRALRHGDGSALAEVYGPEDAGARGATVAFNVLARDGSVLPYADVERLGRGRGVALRGGCFCNPGAAETAFGLGPLASARCFDTLGEDFTIPRFAECLGGATPTGALRASFGPPSNARDIARALDLIASFAH